MSLIVKGSNNSDYEKCPDGILQAVCYAVVDLGLHENTMYEKIDHKCILLFEVNALMSEGEYKGKRFVLSKEYTLSLHKKASLRKDLEIWRNRDFTDEELKGFDLEKLVGVNCTLNIVIKNEYPRIAGIMKQQAGTEKMIPENKDIPEWIKKKATEGMKRLNEQDNNELENATIPHSNQEQQADDDLPF